MERKEGNRTQCAYQYDGKQKRMDPHTSNMCGPVLVPELLYYKVIHLKVVQVRCYMVYTRSCNVGKLNSSRAILAHQTILSSKYI